MFLKHKLRVVGSVLSVSLFTIGFGLFSQGVAHATSGTYYKWTGASSATAGLNSCVSNCWSVAGNWSESTTLNGSYSTASAAPASSDNGGLGDNIILDSSLLSSSSKTIDNDNTGGLTINTINEINTNGGNYSYTITGTALTVTGGVSTVADTSSPPSALVNVPVSFVGTTTYGVSGSTSYPAVPLNGTVAVTSGTLTDYGNLNPTALTVASGATLNIAGSSYVTALSGAGSIVVQSSSTSNPTLFGLYPSAANTFSGTIVVQSAAELYVNGTGPNIASALGTGSLTINSGGQLQLSDSPATYSGSDSITLPNTIIMGGNGAGSSQEEKGAIVAGLYDTNTGQYAGALTVTLSGAVTLASNTTLASSYATATTYNFTGTLSEGGFTLTTVAADQPTYGTATIEINGAAPVTATTAAATVKAPGTPNTGSALVSSKASLPLLGTSTMFGGLYVISRKVKHSKLKQR